MLQGETPAAKGLLVWILEHSTFGQRMVSQSDGLFSTLEAGQSIAECINGEPLMWNTSWGYSFAKGRHRFFWLRQWEVL